MYRFYMRMIALYDFDLEKSHFHQKQLYKYKYIIILVLEKAIKTNRRISVYILIYTYILDGQLTQNHPHHHHRYHSILLIHLQQSVEHNLSR